MNDDCDTESIRRRINALESDIRITDQKILTCRKEIDHLFRNIQIIEKKGGKDCNKRRKLAQTPPCLHRFPPASPRLKIVLAKKKLVVNNPRATIISKRDSLYADLEWNAWFTKICFHIGGTSFVNAMCLDANTKCHEAQ